MKKVIFILILIAATLVVKQSSAQFRPHFLKSPMIRPSMAVKTSVVTIHPLTPPTIARLVPKKLADIDITTDPTQDPNANGGVTYVRLPDPMYFFESDKSVPPDTEIYRYDHYQVVSITEIDIITIIVKSFP